MTIDEIMQEIEDLYDKYISNPLLNDKNKLAFLLEVRYIVGKIYGECKTIKKQTGR